MLVGAPARLPAQGALIVEAVHRVVASLNRTTRAAALWIGGGNGAATVNQVFAWLSGLPLRSRAGPRGWSTNRCASTRHACWPTVLSMRCCGWPASMPARCRRRTALPMVVLGHPALASALRRTGPATVFIPVATPGIGSAGHLFRTDGTVLMPLHAVYHDRLPTRGRCGGPHRFGVARDARRRAA